MGIAVVGQKISRSALWAMTPEAAAFDPSGRMVKAVVDVTRGVMAVGGDLHVEMKERLIKEGSAAEDLWGVRIYFWATLEESIEYVSQINYRPARNNASWHIRDVFLCGTIRRVMERLIDWSS